MSQRDPREGTPLDRFVMYEGGFYQYIAPPRIDPWGGTNPLNLLEPIERTVPACALSVFASRGRWFSEERAEELLETEHIMEGLRK